MGFLPLCAWYNARRNTRIAQRFFGSMVRRRRCTKGFRHKGGTIPHDLSTTAALRRWTMPRIPKRRRHTLTLRRKAVGFWAALRPLFRPSHVKEYSGVLIRLPERCARGGGTLPPLGSTFHSRTGNISRVEIHQTQTKKTNVCACGGAYAFCVLSGHRIISKTPPRGDRDGKRLFYFGKRLRILLFLYGFPNFA